MLCVLCNSLSAIANPVNATDPPHRNTGGSGAGKGAAIGGAMGLLKPGQTIRFPAGTEATFQLELPLQVTWL